MDEIILKVAGQRYGGWKSIEVTRGVDRLAGSFNLTVSDRDPERVGQFTFPAGSACVVELDGEILVNGWIDKLSPGFDANGHEISVSGRDRVADLVDCSAVRKTGSWAGRSLEQIVADLAKPFGITVTAASPTGGPFKKVALQQGETVFEVIDRLARQRGVLPVATPDGNLQFIVPGGRKASFSLQQGKDLLVASAVHDVTERYSHYVLKGQAPGDDYASGETVSSVRGEASDPAISRHRPLVVIGEEGSTTALLKRRALWEASVRRARGQTASLTVQGWRDPAGDIWAPNLVVPVQAPWLMIEADMLIVSVTFSQSDQGRVTRLELAPPAAFTPVPIDKSAEPSRVRKRR